ncbi:MAG: hypothetical protein HY869_06590 [Chloroflexi bacterium]|nr:hypothetical protein [Chloroflexota bacterium]
MEVGDAIGAPHADNRITQTTMRIEFMSFMLALPATETKGALGVAAILYTDAMDVTDSHGKSL